MSLSRLRKAPGRWLESLTSWRRRGGSSRDGHHEAYDTDIGGRCCEVSGNDLNRYRQQQQQQQPRRSRLNPHNTSTTDDDVHVFPEAGIEESATSIQSCNSSITYYNNPPYNTTTNTSSGGSNGGQDQRGGGGRGGLGDDPVLTERDRKELMSLVNENISMDFILEMKEAFQLFDKNGDGFISAKELGVLMRTLGRNPTEDEIMNIMNEIDVDHNGKLDFSEFTIMMKDKLSGEDMEQEIKQAFRVFDRNGDGYISKSEFKHCMMHFGEKFTDDEVEEMMAEADANNDGKIDYTEFSQMILKECGMDKTLQQQQQLETNSKQSTPRRT